MKKITVLFAAIAAFAQNPPAANPAPEGAPLALIRFQVAPQKGKPVTDLRADEIEIREDGVARKVAVLQGGTGGQREIPVEISLVFDCPRTSLASGTLDPKLFQASLLDEFPNVSVGIYGFSPGLSRLAAPTRSQEALAKALDAPLMVHPLSTFLMDHISRVMIDAASNPTAAVRIVAIVSSGQSDDGSTSESQEEDRFKRAVSIAQQANLAAFPVVLMAPLASQDSTPSAAVQRGSRVSGPQITSADISASTRMRALGNYKNLGPASGGKSVDFPASGNMLPTVLKWIADEIRNDYIAGFGVSSAGDKKRHKIEVGMKNKDRGRVTTGAINLVY